MTNQIYDIDEPYVRRTPTSHTHHAPSPGRLSVEDTTLGQSSCSHPVSLRLFCALSSTRTDDVLQRTGLTSLSHLLSRRRISVFGHVDVARLDDDTPANVALQLHISVSLNRPPDRT